MHRRHARPPTVDGYSTHAISAEREPVMGQPAPSGPIYSEDGHWWWDGQQWRPVAQEPGPVPIPTPAPGRNPRSSKIIAAGIAGAVMLAIIGVIALRFNPLSSSQGDVPSGPDLLTPAQASTEVTAFWNAYLTASAKGDNKALQDFFTGPALEEFTVFGSPLPDGQLSHLTVAVAHQSRYPLSLMAELVVQQYQNGVPTGGGTFDMVLTKAEATASWRVSIALATLQFPAMRSDGFAQSPLSVSQEASLLMRPEDVAAAYAKALTALQAGNPDPGSFSKVTPDATIHPDPGFVATGLYTADPSGIVLRSRTTSGGEAILFVIDTNVTVRRADGACFNPLLLAPGSVVRGLLTGGGGPSRLSKAQMTRRIYVQLAIPTSSSGGALEGTALGSTLRTQKVAC